MTAKPGRGSRKARASAARLAAVQTVYQMLADGRDSEQAARDFLDHYAGLQVDGQPLLMPEQELYGRIVRGVGERQDELETLLEKNLENKSYLFDIKRRKIDTLLRAVLLCGAYELLAHHDIDAPIIISDYLNVTHAFYEQKESALVNGVLDSIRGILRE